MQDAVQNKHKILEFAALADTGNVIKTRHSCVNRCFVYYGPFTLADSDSDNNSMKFYCQWVSVSVDTSKQLYTSHLLLGLGQCKHTITGFTVV